MSGTRAFVCIDFSDEVNEKIAEIQNKLPEFRGKKIKMPNLHLTLKFLGEIDNWKVEETKKRLRKIKLGKFKVKIDKLGVFSEKFIRIIWLHLSGAEELQAEVDEKLAGLFEKENRFMSHLTIARVRKIKGKNKFLRELEKIQFEEIEFSVDKFKLNKSVLTELGPLYESLEDYHLS